MFEELRAAAEIQLDALDDSEPEKRLELTFVIARAVRYLAELHHAKNTNGTGRDLLEEFVPTLDTKNASLRNSFWIALVSSRLTHASR